MKEKRQLLIMELKDKQISELVYKLRVCEKALKNTCKWICNDHGDYDETSYNKHMKHEIAEAMNELNLSKEKN